MMWLLYFSLDFVIPYQIAIFWKASSFCIQFKVFKIPYNRALINNINHLFIIWSASVPRIVSVFIKCYISKLIQSWMESRLISGGWLADCWHSRHAAPPLAASPFRHNHAPCSFWPTILIATFNTPHLEHRSNSIKTFVTRPIRIPTKQHFEDFFNSVTISTDWRHRPHFPENRFHSHI